VSGAQQHEKAVGLDVQAWCDLFLLNFVLKMWGGTQGCRIRGKGCCR
jgi:hypothetical protein